MSQQDRDKARQILVPLQECDFCLTCPDDAAQLINAIATALEQRGAEERERSAKIAESHSCKHRNGCQFAIAAAIRQG